MKVFIICPCNFLSSIGVFLDFDNKLALLTTHGLLISTTHKSASLPIWRLPLSIPRIFAGFDVIEAIILFSFMEPLWNNSSARGNKVSIPVAPVAAWANVNLLDSSSSGLWSETITSISPSPIALISDNRSCSVLSGGESFKKVLKSPMSFSFKD